MAGKKETAEQMAAGFLGVLGISLPNFADIANMFQALTIIFSFFFIVIPTGVWASIRAYKAIKNCKKDKKTNV